MKTTYMVENSNRQVTGYFSYYSDARRFLLEQGSGSLTKLIGPYYAEGWHEYYCYLDNGRIRRTTKQWEAYT